jgi:hypothetical protein
VKNKLKVLFAIVAIAGSGAVLYQALIGPGPRFDLAVHEGIGKTMAAEAGSLLGEGGRIVLIARDTSSLPNPPAAAEVKALASALKQMGHPISATNLFKVDPLRLLKPPAGDLAEVMRKMNEKDVLISLLGPPDLNQTQTARVGDRRPKIVALCSGTMPRQINLKRLFEDQFLHVAIVSRTEMAAVNITDAPSAAAFDKLYALVKPANVSELAAYAK